MAMHNNREGEMSQQCRDEWVERLSNIEVVAKP
jgi:hypothetical protein